MADRKHAYIDVDKLMPEVTLEQAAAYYGVTLPELKRVGQEVRTRCFLNCGIAGQTSDRALAIQADSATKIWRCFQYGCDAKGGNLIGLCDLLRSGTNQRGRPRGERFKDIARDLEAMVRGESPSMLEPAPMQRAREASKQTIERNAPLSESENERVRALVDLPQEFVIDPASMPPEASTYFRQRPFLTPESCREFGVGYLPRASKSSLRGKIVYPFHSPTSELLCFYARDPLYEEKLRRWIASGHEGTEPVKYVMPKNFKRGVELWGEDIVRKRFVDAKPLPCGLVVTEGANDAIRLLMLGAPAVALCSNTITPHQVDRVVSLAADCGQTRVGLMLDADTAGEEGVTQAMRLLGRHTDVRLLWSQDGDNGRFRDRQPESLSPDEWADMLASLSTHRSAGQQSA